MSDGLSVDCGRKIIGFSTPFGTVLTIKMSPWRDIARKFHIVLLLQKTDSGILKIQVYNKSIIFFHIKSKKFIMIFIFKTK